MSDAGRMNELGISIDEAKYRNEISFSLRSKIDAFLKKYYPEYSSRLVEMKDSIFFDSLYVHIQFHRMRMN